MKPRLKPTRNGGLRVVQVGSNPWAEVSARQFVREHYGSLLAFAERYHLSYGAVCIALRPSGRAMHMAGQVAVIRHLLGLPSRPSRRALQSASAIDRSTKK